MPQFVVQRSKIRPVKFIAGDRVYLRHQHQVLGGGIEPRHGYVDMEFVVSEQFWHKNFPHYRLVDPDGHEWVASQLELSTSPFTQAR